MDYKAEIQEFAEQMADELHGKDFYSLPQDEQQRVYDRAYQTWCDKLTARAEWESERRRDERMGL